MKTAKQTQTPTPTERTVVIVSQNKDLMEAMAEVVDLEPKHQERVTIFMQGYVAAVAAGRKATA